MVDTSTGLVRDESATQQAGVPSSSSTSELVAGVVMIIVQMIWTTAGVSVRREAIFKSSERSSEL